MEASGPLSVHGLGPGPNIRTPVKFSREAEAKTALMSIYQVKLCCNRLHLVAK